MTRGGGGPGQGGGAPKSEAVYTSVRTCAMKSTASAWEAKALLARQFCAPMGQVHAHDEQLGCFAILGMRQARRREMRMPASELRRSSAMALQRVYKTMGASVTSSGSLSAWTASTRSAFARAPLAWSGKAETRHRCALVLRFRHLLIKGSELGIQLVEHEFVVTRYSRATRR